MADGQRRGRRIALTPEQRDRFLDAQRTCRVATVGPEGSPHVSALWFVWVDDAVWMSTIVRSQRWENLSRDPRVSVLVDDGETYGELRGVQIQGTTAVVGEVPRRGEVSSGLERVELRYAQKYYGTDELVHDERHAWLRVEPTKIVSWDFRALPT